MSVEIIGDPGSCHMGRLDLARELIRVGAECGLDAVKFQLLEAPQVLDGNIRLPWEWLLELRDYGADLGISVFASVFSWEGIRFLQRHQFHQIKFPYRQWELFVEACYEISDMQTYVSTDCMRPVVPARMKTLYCISEYPVPYVVNFEGLFPRFDGFSSHCLGTIQDFRALWNGAKILEKHYTLDHPEIACPDHQFAIRPYQLKELCDHAHSTGRSRGLFGISDSPQSP